MLCVPIQRGTNELGTSCVLLLLRLIVVCVKHHHWEARQRKAMKHHLRRHSMDPHLNATSQRVTSFSTPPLTPNYPVPLYTLFTHTGGIRIWEAGEFIPFLSRLQTGAVCKRGVTQQHLIQQRKSREVCSPGAPSLVELAASVILAASVR